MREQRVTNFRITMHRNFHLKSRVQKVLASIAWVTLLVLMYFIKK